MPEKFTPPKEIHTEHLLIRPFQSAEEELTYFPTLGTIINSKDSVQYYAPNDSPFKQYAIFLRASNDFVGTINLCGDKVKIGGQEYIISSHMRNLDSRYHNLGFGTEALKAIIDHIMKPATGKTVFTKPFDCDEITGEYALRISESIPFFGHEAAVECTNYASIFSNIKAGMSVDGIIMGMKEVAMFYPPRGSAPDAFLIRDLFKAISAYDKEPSAELQSTLRETLHNVMLSTQEPHTVISAAHILLEKCEENVSAIPALSTKLQEAYNTLVEAGDKDCFSWAQTLADCNEVHYNAENDPLYKEVMCSGDTTAELSE